MNTKKYQAALVSLEELHWHLYHSGGPDLWTMDLLRRFKEAVNDHDDIDDEIVFLAAEPPQPAA